MSTRIAQVFGVAGAAWLAGNIGSISLLTVPALEKSHTCDGVSSATLARQWLYMYEQGKTQNPPVALATTACLGYLAWSYEAGALHHQGILRSPTQLYSVAALLTIGIVPYTILFMARTNNSLNSKAEQAADKGKDAAAEVEDDGATVELIKRWNIYNIFRSLLPLVGAVSALAATLA